MNNKSKIIKDLFSKIQETTTKYKSRKFDEQRKKTKFDKSINEHRINARDPSAESKVLNGIERERRTS